jgi:hypothetical protein
VTRTPAALAALALAALAGLASPSASADPTLPEGWVAGGAAAPLAPPTAPSRRSRTALQQNQSPVRPALEAATLSLADVDVADVEPAPTWQQVEASNAEPPGDPPQDLFIAPRCRRISATGHAYGSVTFGFDEEPIVGPQSGGGVELGEGYKGDGKHLYQRLEWETLDRLPDGTMRFTETVARHNVVLCKAKVARRYTVIARPILGGRAYVFRTRCAACAPTERDVIHVIAGDGWNEAPYGRHAFPLVPGAAGGFTTRVDTFQLRKFAAFVKAPLADPPEGKQAVIGVEAAQTLGESAPTLIAYTFDDAPRQWGF